MNQARRTVLLVGAGHAHLEVIRRHREIEAAGGRLVLVEPADFHYSGRASAVIGGASARNNCVDVEALCRACGIQRIAQRMAGLERAARRISLRNGGAIDYDILSLNIGSAPDPRLTCGVGIVPVKPISHLASLRLLIEAEGHVRPRRILVVGGGASGVEIAGHLASLGRRLPHPPSISLLTRGSALLTRGPDRAGRLALENLSSRGIDVHSRWNVARLEEGCAVEAGGRQMSFDRAVLAGGLVATPLVGRLGLSVVPGRGLLVSPALHSVDDRHIFAVGDCAAIEGFERPKAGVFAVRAAPVLVANIVALLRGQPLSLYRPQRRFLWIVSLGDGSAVAIRGRQAVHGSLPQTLKNVIDRRFLSRYRRIYGSRQPID